MNILYWDVDNPLAVAAENCPCSKIIVKTDNGTIKGKGCSWVFHTDSGWKATITVFRKSSSGLIKIGESIFRVRPIPYPVPRVGPSAGGPISAVVLRSQYFIRAEYDDFYIDRFGPVDSFRVSIIRGDTCLYNRIKNTGGEFSDELVKALADIKKGDAVIFKNIYGRRHNGQSVRLEPLIFFVTD